MPAPPLEIALWLLPAPPVACGLLSPGLGAFVSLLPSQPHSSGAPGPQTGYGGYGEARALWVAGPPLSSCSRCPHYRAAWCGAGKDCLFDRHSGGVRLLGAGGEDQLFHLQSWSWSLDLKASLGLIESPCLTIASNFIAFMERRVLFLAAKIFYVPIFFYGFCLLVGRWGPRLFISSK